MQLSTRNILKGKVVEVKEGMIMAKVRVDIGGGNVITAIITDDALKDLNVKVGDDLTVLIKATSVMVAMDIRCFPDIAQVAVSWPRRRRVLLCLSRST